MPTALGVLAATAVAALLNARPAPPPVVVRMRDGTSIEIPVPRVTASQKYIVQFRDAKPSSRATIDRFRRDLASLRRGRIAADGVAIEHEYFRAFHGVSATLDAASVEAVRRLPYVKRVAEDEQVKAFADDGHLTRIGADRMWSEFNVRGDGIVVAVIDSGVDYMHAALGGGIGAGFKVAGGHDFVADDDDPMDEHGHGTHVAGILAGGNDAVRGVAPNAKLLAYRVLGANGVGETSDVIAAIERTVDPNGDGDLSDHADVANLSLGGGGNADSPISQAVDNATLAGVVVCLAAGNTGGEYTIGAPASARLGITVGASESEDHLAIYSSRGPSVPDWGLKPELVAPGSAILSAKLGGGTVLGTGTSMATPHVAGAAALLLQLHPDRSPADVKSALVGSASSIGEHAMGEGGGRIDIPAAATMAGAIVPSAVTFGRDGGKNAWTSTRTVRITNRGLSEATYHAGFITPPEIVVTAEPAEVTLAPGAGHDVLLTASISAAAGAALQNLSHGGQVIFSSADDAVHMPWVAVDAARVIITHERPSIVTWTCERGPFVPPMAGGTVFDLLLLNSRCDVAALTVPTDGQSREERLPTVFIARSFDVENDLDLALTLADAPYETRAEGVDERGTLLGNVSVNGSRLDKPYACMYDFQFPPGSNLRAMWMGALFSDPLRTSDLADGFKITVSEIGFDHPRGKLYAIHHPTLHGVHGSATLASVPSDLRHARVTIAPQQPGTTLNALFPVSFGGLLGYLAFHPFQTLEHGWSGDLYATPEASPYTWGNAGVRTERPEDGVNLDWNSPAFRAIGDEIVVSDMPVPSPAAYRVGEHGTIALGESLLHSETAVWLSGTRFRIVPNMTGPAGEVHEDANSFTFELRDGAGVLLRRGSAWPFLSDDFGQAGRYRADLKMKNGGELLLAFDTSIPDFHPPSITSLRVVDADGRIVSRIARSASATLAFSAIDLTTLPDSDYLNDFAAPVVRASWRTAGGPWQVLPLDDVVLTDLDNPIDSRHLESGVHYRVDLGPITRSVYGRIDLRIELEDSSGNASTSIIEDALEIGGRRRAAGK
jgi:hypothetical protein